MQQQTEEATAAASATSEMLGNWTSVLNDFQRDIFAECLEKQHAGLSIPMGGGKTRLALVLGLELTPDAPTLVVCSKTLISTWIDEINKAFGGSTRVPFYVYHKDYNRVDISTVPSGVRVVITTPQVTAQKYAIFDMEPRVIVRRVENAGRFQQHEIIDYTCTPEVLTREQGGLLYGTHWGTFIVDEFHTHCNVLSNQFRSLLCVPAQRKWCMSGTLFNEPRPERILAYFLFIEDTSFPNNLPDATKHMKSREFKGADRTMIRRSRVPMDTPVVRREQTIMVDFVREEQTIYEMVRTLTLDIAAAVKEHKRSGDEESRREFSGYLLGMLTSLRQCIVSPVLPLSTIALDICNLAERSAISRRFSEKIAELQIEAFLDDEENAISTRMREAIKICMSHQKVVVFTAFRTALLLMMEEVRRTGRTVFTLDGTMSLRARAKVIDDCRRSDDFVFFLTYGIGCAGINHSRSRGLRMERQQHHAGHCTCRETRTG